MQSTLELAAVIRAVILCPVLTPHRRNLNTEISLRKRIKCFPSSLRRRNLKDATSMSPVILNLSLRKTWSRISHDYLHAIVFENGLFQKMFSVHTWNEKPTFSNSSASKSVLEKLRFHYGSVPNRKIELHFEISPVECGRDLNKRRWNWNGWSLFLSHFLGTIFRHCHWKSHNNNNSFCGYAHVS